VPPLVCIVVLSWNGLGDTLRCIASLERQTYPNCRILVFDNGSTDGSVAALQALGTRIRLIESAANLGYTGGNNRAMEAALADGADYVWLFNNDAVAAPDTLATLVALAEADARIGLVSPVVREGAGPDAAVSGCALIDLAGPFYSPSFDLAQAQHWQARFPDRIALHGTALLVRRAVVERIGGLDERLFAYWEDIDYSIRSFAAGFRNVMAIAASIEHPPKPSQTAPAEVRPHCYYYVARNELLMWRNFVPKRSRRRAALWSAVRQLHQVRRMPAYPAGIEAVLTGMWDGWCGIGGAWDPRRRMPQPLRWLLGRYPGVWLWLVDCVTTTSTVLRRK
jgi:GT2 family glycosyltransferase